jgi:tetratricopeptide (TPR) repeat protein
MDKKTLELKRSGDRHFGAGHFAEALLDYTQALMITPDEVSLLTSRAQAFLKMDQFFHAYHDVKAAIRLQPREVQNFLRKGDIECRTSHYSEALDTYRTALRLDSKGNHEDHIMEAMRQATVNLHKQRSGDAQYPWVAAAFGLVVGIFAVVCDFVAFQSKGFLGNPLLKLVVIAMVSVLFYQGVYFYRKHLQNCRNELLAPPPDIFGDDLDSDSDQKSCFDKSK